MRRGGAGRRRGSDVVCAVHQRWIFLAVALACRRRCCMRRGRPRPMPCPDRTSLAGQLLIASPELRQPDIRSRRHPAGAAHREGALGIVINRPGEKHPIADLLTAFGADAAGVHGRSRCFSAARSIRASALWCTAPNIRPPDTLDIDGRVALTIAPEVLRDIGLGKGPRKSLVAFGYAGWAPSQLDDELAHGVWITVPEDPALVFDDDRAKVWDDALARQKRTVNSLSAPPPPAASPFLPSWPPRNRGTRRSTIPAVHRCREWPAQSAWACRTSGRSASVWFVLAHIYFMRALCPPRFALDQPRRVGSEERGGEIRHSGARRAPSPRAAGRRSGSGGAAAC